MVEVGELEESERVEEGEIWVEEEAKESPLGSVGPEVGADVVEDLMTEVSSCFLTRRPLFPSPPKIDLFPELYLLLQNSLAYTPSCATTS